MASVDTNLDCLTIRLSSLEQPPCVGDLVYYPSTFGSQAVDNGVNTPAIVVDFISPYVDSFTGKLIGGSMTIIRADGNTISDRRLDGWHVVSTFGDAL